MIQSLSVVTDRGVVRLAGFGSEEECVLLWPDFLREPFKAVNVGPARIQQILDGAETTDRLTSQFFDAAGDHIHSGRSADVLIRLRVDAEIADLIPTTIDIPMITVADFNRYRLRFVEDHRTPGRVWVSTLEALRGARMRAIVEAKVYPWD